MKLTSQRETIWTLELTDDELAILYNLLYGKIIDQDNNKIIDNLKKLFETYHPPPSDLASFFATKESSKDDNEEKYSSYLREEVL